MDNGHPITVFLVTALSLWALWLWHQHRLGVIASPGKVSWSITPSRIIAPLSVAKILPPGPAWPPVVPISPPAGSVLAPPTYTGPPAEPLVGGAPTLDEILGGY